MSIHLVSLTLQNFKKHADITVQFADGLTVIRGPNWAGKSTILQGILFALFGTHAVPGRKEHLTRKGAAKMSVSLVFNDDGEEFQVVRTPTAASVKIDGVDIVTGMSAVDEWVQVRMGLDRKTALQLAVSPQSQTAALLTLGVPVINRLVESLSGADSVETWIEKAGQKAKDVGNQAAATPVCDIEALEVSQEVMQKALAEAEKKVAALDAAVGDAEASVEAAEKSMDEAKAIHVKRQQALAAHARYQDFRSRITESANRIEAHEKSLAGLPASDLVELEVRELQLRTEQLEFSKQWARRQELVNWFDTVGKQYEDAEAAIQAHQSAVEALESHQRQVDPSDAYNESKGRLANLKRRQNELEVGLESGVCETCHRPLDDHASEDERALMQADIDRIGREIDDLQKLTVLQEREAREYKAKMSVLANHVRSLATKLPPEDYEEQYNTRSAELDTLPAEPFDTTELTRVAKDLKTARKVEAERSTLQTQIGMLQAGIKVLEEDASKALAEAEGWDTLPEVNLDQYTQAVSETKEALKGLNTSRLEVIAEVQWQSAQIAMVEKGIEEGKRSNQMVSDLLKKHARWVSFQKWLRDNKTRLLESLWDSILESASRFLSEATGGTATRLERSDDGEFSIVESGLDMPVSSVSGGMAAIAGTAMKLALVDLLPTAPRFLLLDEPSSELNDENAARLAAALSGQDRQIVLVTHRTGEEYLADRLVDLSEP